jgi:hypothetical protein
MSRLSILLAAAGLAPLALSPAVAAPVKMATPLTAAAEAPGPGDTKGSGSAELAFDADKGEVCYMLMSKGTDTPTAAHIHKAAAGVAGPPVVPLTPPANGMSEGCAPVEAALMAAILATPADYYVNVHTAAFPKGALRGQLGQ